MSTSKTPFIATPNFFCTLSNPKLPSHHFFINTPPKFHKKPLPKLFVRTISSQIQNPSIRHRRHGRRRRNSLRDKLLKENGQVGENPQLSENGKSGNSPLWDKLESWVDRYKEDSEMWGLGARPIFTIYEDSDGNVVRVSVDEDEIARRARVRAWSFEERDAAADEEFEDAGSKISRARLIAKGIEEGTCSIARNSSVAKFVVEKEEEGVACLGHEAVSKDFPQIGFGAVSKGIPLIGLAALCGVCVFWVTARMFAGGEKVGLKREEVEMLRRKKEFRMKTERFEKGNLKVLPEVEALPAAHTVRPQLDRNEMMRSIEQARMTREGLAHSSVNDSDFDDKVAEIREMARKARETERRDRSQNGKQGEDVDLKSVLLPISDRDGKNLELLKDLRDMKPVGENRKDYIDVIADGKPSDTVGADSDMVSSEAVDPHVNHGKNVEHAMVDTKHVLDIENGKMVGKTNEDYKKNILYGESLKPSGTNTGIATIKVVDSIAAHGKNTQHSADIESRKLVREDGKDCRNISSKLLGNNRETVTSNGDDHKSDAVGFSGKMPIEVDGKKSVDRSISSTASTNAFSNKETRENKTKKINFMKASNNVMSPASGFGSKNKPKIIKSVKQAREYLAEKNGTSTHEKTQLKQGKQLKKRPAAYTNAPTRSHDDKPFDGVINKAGNEKFEVIDSTCGGIGSVNSRKDSQADYVSGTKLHEDDRNNNGKKRVVQEGKVELSHDIPIGKSEKTLDINVVTHTSAVDDSETDNVVHSSKNLHCGDTENTDSWLSKQNDSGGEQINTENETWRDHYSLHAAGNKQGLENQGIPYDDVSNGSSVKGRTGIEEIGDYFSQELDELSNKDYLYSKARLRKSENDTGDCNITEDWTVLPDGKMVESADVTLSADNSSEKLISRDDELVIDASSLPANTNLSIDLELPLEVAEDSDGMHETEDIPRSKTSIRQNSDGSDCQTEPSSLRVEKSWVEENFQQLDPIIKKIGDGFTTNYMVAKEKVQGQSSLCPNIREIRSLVEEEELEWMNDEKLSEIVFKVRDNELAGRDPFHMMDTDDQHAFFKGLERKAEKINDKLLGVHEYLHSRIENVDYGADGISLYDPLEKIVPRWKSPAIAKEPEFLNERTAHKKVNFDGDVRSDLQKSEGLPNSICAPSSLVNERISNGTSKSNKTVIECSDGSSRPGKKTGKEHWQHTKKWSQGFLDVYNAETDPEIKSIMKNMGKDLDRWATEKDIEDTADLMTKLPKKKRRYIEKKMDKLKREMEMFGPQAVVSKYREYSDEKEDYLWWLDLQFVLCIELYTIEDDVAKVGFYSLEMAAELELDPKQHHVIAFEDPGDCKSFCYIIQAQMDLLGNGRAFVVARPPKDAFREAKANGFNVTVIRKGEVKLNVDETLDEVEVKLVEIGSKIYHDKLMHERGFDIQTLMKGVITADKATKKKPKKMIEETGKSKSL